MKTQFQNILILIVFCVVNVQAQNNYEITIGEDLPYLEGNHFEQGTNTNPDGESLTLNNFFLKEGGKPILPVMGEIHYTRYPKEEWEEAILKMKASGINIIACYSFWIHHEEEEGNIRFDGNLDIRYFLELCKKHDMQAFVRIGPWCHGECINGGYPMWYQLKIGTRRLQTVNEVNEKYIRRWYAALAEQFKGLYYKDGGPIVAMQVDNEVRAASKESPAYQYQIDLKRIAVEEGIDVPIYTATGWSGVVPEDEMMPTYGGYPAAPWTGNSKPLPPMENYLFYANRKDPNVGTDLGLNAAGDKEEDRSNIYRHPFFTVEMGGGNQISYHRRPVIEGKDLLALVYTRLGCGANSMGYYVYHGGQNPLSWNKEYSTQEGRDNGPFPYPNDYPLISYDFQAPITEWGFIRNSYHDFKLMHLFLDAYGSDLATMYPVLPVGNPTDPADAEHLRYSVRSRFGSGYVFVNNYVRNMKMKDHHDVSFTVNTPKGTVRIPDGTINIPNETYAVFPFNLKIEDATMTYATAHPFAKIDGDTPVLFYYSIPGVSPEFKFEQKGISSVKVKGCKKTIKNGGIVIKPIEPEKDSWFTVKTSAGKKFMVYNVSYKKARHAYKFNLKGKEHLVITGKLAFVDETKNEMEIRSLGETRFKIQVYPTTSFKGTEITKAGKEGLFSVYQIDLSAKELKDADSLVTVKQETPTRTFIEASRGLRKNPTGPLHKIRLNPYKLYLKYSVEFPKQLPKNVNNLLVEFDYRGNTAALYADGLIVADDYYSGLKMPVGLKRLEEKLDSKFTFQITPLLKDYNIFFESGTDLEFARTRHGELKSVRVTPEYKVLIKY